MTSQTQKFIELSDILALKLECKHCESVLAIPSSRDMARREDVGKLSICPVCQRPWATLGGATYEPLIAKFVSALNEMRNAFKDAPIGFTLTLEISSDPVSTAKD
jgi:hypothetical protein